MKKETGEKWMAERLRELGYKVEKLSLADLQEIAEATDCFKNSKALEILVYDIQLQYRTDASWFSQILLLRDEARLALSVDADYMAWDEARHQDLRDHGGF